MQERIREKLTILADAAKYDVSCSSSGSKRKNTADGLGNSEGMGICHSYTEDGRRHYGLHYDQKNTQFVTFDVENHFRLRQLPAETLNEEERNYQVLWKDYFHSVNIPERRNLKLHLQHVPKRYWKYLMEK